MNGNGQLAGELSSTRTGARTPVAIIGAACRTPGATNLDELWDLLAQRKIAAGPLPGDRWRETGCDLPREMSTAGNFFPDIWGFDCGFFGIAPRQALAIDPQQRLLLELAWEAMDNAGLTAEALTGTKTGLYIGLMHNEYGSLLEQADGAIGWDAHVATGTDFAFASGRISYRMGWCGPSLVFSTACSSSLVAVHAACRSLREGECDTTFAGGANLLLTARGSAMLAHAGALSPDGRCRAFDARANGFGRGEGGGIVALRRLDDALRAGDRILAIIRGSAVNHDGASGGLTVPSGRAQEQLIQTALNDAALDARQIDYVEAHGTGTRLGDPIELHALGAVLGKDREATHPLLVGSLKSNLGHLEAAAGVLGLLKVVAAFDRQMLVPQPDLSELNPLVDWGRIAVRPLREAVEWRRGRGARFAGVSSFGMAGTNAHVILEQPPAPGRQLAEGAAHSLVISARSPAALRELAARTLRMLPQVQSLPDFCWSMRTRRTQLSHRWEFHFASHEELAGQLRVAAGGAAPREYAPVQPEAKPRSFVPGPVYPWQHQTLRPSFPAARIGGAARSETAAASPAASLRERIAAAPPSCRPAIMRLHVEECVEAVLGRKLEVPESRRGFLDIGIDSIAGLDLLRRIEAGTGQKQPATALFEYPTIDVLSARLLQYIADEAAPEARAESMEVTAP